MAGGLQYIRESRNMPWLRRGMVVDLDGRKGKITSGGPSGHVHVLFEDRTFPCPCHPQWQMTYYAKSGEVIANYKT